MKRKTGIVSGCQLEAPSSIPDVWVVALVDFEALGDEVKVDDAVDDDGTLGPDEKMTEPVSVGEMVEVITLVEVTVVCARLIPAIKAMNTMRDDLRFMLG